MDPTFYRLRSIMTAAMLAMPVCAVLGFPYVALACGVFGLAIFGVMFAREF